MTPDSLIDRHRIFAILFAIALGACRFGPPERQLTTLNIEPGPMPVSRGAVIAISPDGSRVAVVLRGPDGVPRLHTRALDRAAGLDGADGAYNPFFSPDGRSIGFAADGKLKTVAVEGGDVATLCDAPDVRGASWGDSGDVVFAPADEGGLWRVPSGGGAPVALTTPGPGERTHRWPHVLPGSEAVLFTSHSSVVDFDHARIEALDLKTGRRKLLRRGGFAPRFVTVPDGSGRLLYASKGTVFAAPFDAAALDPRGEPAAVLKGIHSSAVAGASFEVSASGALVFVAASADGGPILPTRLTSLLNFTDGLQR